MATCNCSKTELETGLSLIFYFRWDYCPLERGGYTSFNILQCKECNGMVAFPWENYLLAEKEGTEKVKQILSLLFHDKFLLPVTG